MPNPIIIIFDYNQVPAGETLLQNNFAGLFKEGYKTYLDEEAEGSSLDDKRSVMRSGLEELKDLPADSPDFWQKEVLEAKSRTIQLLVKHRFQYLAYDLTKEISALLVRSNYDAVFKHPKGAGQGLNDLFSGKIPGLEGVAQRRNELMDEKFVKYAFHAKSGVLCISGVYNANHLLTYLRKKFPERDVLSYFAFQGEPFEEFEVKARDPQLNGTIFPFGAHLIDMDHDAEHAKTAIVDDLAIYKNMVVKLDDIKEKLNQKTVAAEQVQGMQNELEVLKTSCQRLSALNNADLYLATIDICLLKCAIERKDVEYVKAQYPLTLRKVHALPNSELKNGLNLMAKDILIKYRAATQDSAATSASTNSNAHFSNSASNQAEAPSTSIQPTK